ncbi:hypothetical protein FIBSPDRAFT_1040164 [Athelia psychrophila]|uniref:Uncharacterized protein n=1 Tax=Athelia psychrophila TaxID=1759441 RepID=A0A166QKX4_9AGAM|nr:hypothetical protein FIBSPDRAFT_1040164 [Fibularhizoctonia sp. CBS 109695]
MSFCLMSTPEARKPRPMSLNTTLPDGSLNLLATVFVQRWHGPDEWPTAMPDLRSINRMRLPTSRRSNWKTLG